MSAIPAEPTELMHANGYLELEPVLENNQNGIVIETISPDGLRTTGPICILNLIYMQLYDFKYGQNIGEFSEMFANTLYPLERSYDHI